MPWPRPEDRGREPTDAAWAKAVKERDRYTCRRCGYRGPDVEADHIVNVKAGGKNTMENGQTLCPRCHKPKSQAEAMAGRRAKFDRPKPPHPGLLPGR